MSDEIGHGPIGWRNPLKVPGRSVRPAQTGRFGAGAWNLGNVSFTSTNTSDWLTVASVTGSNGPLINSRAAELFMPFSLHVKHSAGTARFGVALYLYADETLNELLANPYVVDNVYLATANEWTFVSGVGAMPTNIAKLGYHAMLLAVRNYTAGTITAIQGPWDFFGWHMAGV